MNSEDPTKPKDDDYSNGHPSRSLEPRARGYGIGGGYERAYRKRPAPANEPGDLYGPLPHSGYYGTGDGTQRFKHGQAGFDDELVWYRAQYGENTSGQTND